MDIIKRTLKDKSISAIADVVVTIIVLAVPDACTRLLLLLSFLYGYYREQIIAKARVNDSSPSFTINRFGSSDSGFDSLSSVSGSTERFPTKDDHLGNSITNAGEQSQELGWPKDSEPTSTMSEDEEDLVVDGDPGNIRDQDDTISDISTNTIFSTNDKSLMSSSRADNLQKDPMNNSYPLNGTLRTLLEEIEELNIDIQELINNGNITLGERQDGAIKELKHTITADLGKLKDQSRKARNAFKLEARQCLSDKVAEELIQNSVTERNHQLTQEASELMKDINSWIKERGLDLLPTSAGKEAKIIWPTFTGEHLPLVGDFLAEMEELMIREALPMPDRGAVLNSHVDGQAKSILKAATYERNPSFNQLANILKIHFGVTSTQMGMIKRLHQEHGAIPTVSDMDVGMVDVCSVVRSHIMLLEAASGLHRQYLAGNISEDPLTGSYINAIEGYLPREDQKQLASIPGYNLMETQQRFHKIHHQFAFIHQFALTELRHSQVTSVAGNGNTRNPGTTKLLPRFPDPPPTNPIYLPPPTICNHNKNIQCCRCRPNMSTINKRASPCHDWNSVDKLTFPYPPPFISG